GTSWCARASTGHCCHDGWRIDHGPRCRRPQAFRRTAQGSGERTYLRLHLNAYICAGVFLNMNMMSIIFKSHNELCDCPRPTATASPSPLHVCDHTLKSFPMRSKKSTALVTGASSGIGKATAERLATAGYTVYGTSRRGAQANQQPFAMLSLDVTRNESVEAVVKEVIRLEGHIDLLVNNAGFGVAPAGAEESSIEQAQAIFDTNFFGMVRMTRAVVPHMRRQGAGRVINIGSIFGFLPMPYMALYVATKHAIEGYSESLDHELRTRGIRVSVIEPANTSTQFDA